MGFFFFSRVLYISDSLSFPQAFLPHYSIINFCEILKKKMDYFKIHNLLCASIDSILLGGTGHISPFLCLVFKAVDIAREKKARHWESAYTFSERGR